MPQLPVAYVVDDDPLSLELMSAILGDAGYRVETERSSLVARTRIPELNPDLVLLDLMMPELDGIDLLQQLRTMPQLALTRIVVVSAKPYEFDRKRALQFGADGYFIKPVYPTALIKALDEIMTRRTTVTFWGVRGTMPVPGRDALEYGGNTSCVTVETFRDDLFIFDAGTGLKPLSDALLARRKLPIIGKIFISHPHWDHINALPFFVPLYLQGNEFEILGPWHGNATMRELISAQMDGVYFPISIKEFGARVYFRDLMEGSLELRAGVTVKTMLLTHPGNCLGYRLEFRDRAFCYVTDNELYPPGHPHHNPAYWDKLVAFVAGAEMLVTDCTYTDDEYLKKIGWGHSAVSQVVELAHRAAVKRLFLFHHDPDQKDRDIAHKLEHARQLLAARHSSVECLAPREGESFAL